MNIGGYYYDNTIPWMVKSEQVCYYIALAGII
jgi:hypothetical protein